MRALGALVTAVFAALTTGKRLSGNGSAASPLQWVWSLSYWIDPAAGNDANPGTQASPFRTWHGGFVPLLGTLAYADITVNYVGATLDTSDLTATVPIGVRVTLVAEWADNGLGQRVVAAGSTQASVNVVGGGMAVNGQAGTRIRWLAGAANTGVYSVVANTAAALVAGSNGLPSVPVAGDRFVLERPRGGWAPGAPCQIDVSAPGAAIVFRGFKIAPTADVSVSFAGQSLSLAGLYLEQGGTAAFLNLRVVNVLCGQVDGGYADPTAPLGSVQNLCCYFHGSGLALFTTTGVFVGQDPVFAGASAEHLGAQLDYSGFVLIGTGAQLVCQYGCTLSLFGNQIGASTTVPISCTGCSGQITSCTFDAALAADAIVLDNSRVEIDFCTGVNATAGKVGVRLTCGTAITNGGGNTVKGGAGALQIGGNAAPTAAWPAAGTTASDQGAGAATQFCVVR